MNVKTISTVFTTSKNQTIASGYKKELYASKKAMFEDFCNDVNLQFESYEGLIETFNVVISGVDGEVENLNYNEEDEGGINPFDVIEDVKNIIGIEE